MVSIPLENGDSYDFSTNFTAVALYCQWQGSILAVVRGDHNIVQTSVMTRILAHEKTNF